METIKSLEKISFDELFAAFSEAFCDYEMQVNKDELWVMISRRGYVPELSFGAFEKDKLISFTLNGIGFFNGKKTAYDTGTGTIAEHRGKGIASRIFLHTLPFLIDAGVSQYLLEVLQHNKNAVSVYKKLGFEISRAFNYFKQTVAELSLLPKKLPENYCIKQTNLEYQDQFTEFFDFEPSWQNSFEAISRRSDDFKIIAVFEGVRPVGFCVLEPVSGDVTLIAVDRKYRRQGIASVLLREAMKLNRHTYVKIINTEIHCEAITHFLNSNGIPLAGKQFEMIKKL